MAGRAGDEHMRWLVWPGGLPGGGRLKQQERKEKKLGS